MAKPRTFIQSFRATAHKLGIPENEQIRLADGLKYKGLKTKLRKAENGDELTESLASFDSKVNEAKQNKLSSNRYISFLDNVKI